MARIRPWHILISLVLFSFVYFQISPRYDERLHFHCRKLETSNSSEDDICSPPYSYNPHFKTNDGSLITEGEPMIKISRKYSGNDMWKKKLIDHINSEKPQVYKVLRNCEVFTYKYISPMIHFLEISVLVFDYNHLSLIIRDAENIRWEVPYDFPFPYVKDQETIPLEESNFIFSLQEAPFNIKISRRDTNEVIFQILNPFIYTDLYTEINFETPTNEIYGLGERLYTLQYKPGTYTLFIYDRWGDLERGEPGHNQQGQHPVYLMKEKSGKYHMNLLRNINYQEITIRETNQHTWKIVGGIVDFNIFLGDSPEEVVRKYHEYVGGWSLPAFWTLGHHQSKWKSYVSYNEFEEVLEKYNRQKIPLDAVWSDIDYMEDNINFSIDEINFPSAKTRKTLGKHKKRWVPIIDPNVPVVKKGPAWDHPDVEDIILKDFTNKSFWQGVYLGIPVHVIDFLQPKAEGFLHDMLEGLYKKIPFAGLWNDANEVAMNKKRESHPERKYGVLPFYPGQLDLYKGDCIDPDAIHYDNIDEFNAKPITSLLQNYYTYNFLKTKSRYPFILSRGTMFGSKYAAHFLADIWSDWESLSISIGSCLTMNIFGIVFVGSDTCGFNGLYATDDELCARWYQLSTFLPFSRNNHQPGSLNNQEPYQYDGKHFETILDSLRLRYSLLKYFYTLFFRANGTGTIVRPLFFEFYKDPTLPPYGNSVHDIQFLLGDSIMIAPVLEKFVKTIEVYFPQGRWYDLRDYSEIKNTGQSHLIGVSLPGEPAHFLRGGSVYYKQNTEKVLSSSDLKNSFKLIIGLSEFQGDHAEAFGMIMDASSYDEFYIYKACSQLNCLMNISAIFTIGNNTTPDHLHLSFKRHEPGLPGNQIIEEIVLMGVLEERVAGYNKLMTGKEVLNYKFLAGGSILISKLNFIFMDSMKYTIFFSN